METVKRTIVYKYGLPFGPDNEETYSLFQDITWKAHRYYNNKVELFRSKVMAIRALEEQKFPKVLSIENQISNLMKQKEADISKEDRKELNQKIKALRQGRKKLREENKESMEKIYSMVEENFKVLEKAARKECGMHNGTYNLVEDAVKDSVKKKKGFPDFKKSFPAVLPRNGKPCSGIDGRVGTQIISSNGKLLFTDNLLDGTHAQIKVEQQPGQPSKYKTLKLQMDTDEKGKPIYGQFKMVYHRPLPADAEIKKAWVQREKIGKRWFWEVCFVIQTQVKKVEHPSDLSCSFDAGWRVMKDGIRIGMVVDTKDQAREIRLPKSGKRKDKNIHERMEYVDNLNSIRANHFNKFKEDLGKWAKDNPKSVPNFVTDKLPHLSKIRSQRKFIQVYFQWRGERTPGDEVGFKLIEAWAKKEEHLFPWQENYRSRTLNCRKDFYRKLANDLCKKYSTIVREDLSLSEMALLSKTRDEKGMKDKDDLHLTARRNRTRASISEFFDALELVAPKYGTRILKVNPAYTSKTCNSCNEICELDSTNHVHTCEHCGAVWDREVNACRNLLKKK